MVGGSAYSSEGPGIIVGLGSGVLVNWPKCDLNVLYPT